MLLKHFHILTLLRSNLACATTFKIILHPQASAPTMPCECKSSKEHIAIGTARSTSSLSTMTETYQPAGYKECDTRMVGTPGSLPHQKAELLQPYKRAKLGNIPKSVNMPEVCT